MTEWFREWIAKVAKDFVTCFITKDRWKYIVKGLGNTLQIALAAVLLGILIGTIVAIIRSTHDKTHETMRPGPGRTLLNIANWLCKVYLTVIRGTPAMIQILIMFFVVFSTARNGTPVAMLTFGINSGAYVAEIIRGGIMAVDEGQNEAGRSLGLNFAQTMLYIIIPQALKNVLPALANEFIVLLKETSVACYVLPYIHSPLLDNALHKVWLMAMGSLPMWAALTLILHPPAPSPSQITLSFLVALTAGVLGTSVFLFARAQATRPQQLAAIDATQGSEIIFALLGGMLLLGTPLPSLLSFVGIALVIIGLTLFGKAND